MTVDLRKRALVTLGISACAMACLAPGLFLALIGGASAAALGAPVTMVLVALTAAIGYIFLRRRSRHACAGDGCNCA